MKIVKNRQKNLCMCTFAHPKLLKKLKLRAKYPPSKRWTVRKVRLTSEEADMYEEAMNVYWQTLGEHCTISKDGECEEERDHTTIGVTWIGKTCTVCEQEIGYPRLHPPVETTTTSPLLYSDYNYLRILGQPEVSYYGEEELQYDNRTIQEREDDQY